MFPIITFGEDEEGEAYFAVVTANGKGIYKLSPGTAASGKGSDDKSIAANSDLPNEKKEHFGKIKNLLSRLKR